MKDMFCASQAATAICLSMEELGSSSSASSSTIQLGGGSISGSRAIDRYNPIIRDSRRTGPKSASAPCSAHSPISPKPQNKNRKSTSKETKRKGGSRKPLIPKVDEKRKSSVEANENINNGVMKTRSWSCRNPGEFITPPGSSRYLLSEKNVLDALSDFDPVLKLSNPSSVEDVKIETDESCPPKPPPSSNQKDTENILLVQVFYNIVKKRYFTAWSFRHHSVVVLRVSLHCRGCERKMRKHISRMQGVKSFNIDFAAKKVTVTGDVTPLGVLASISKVKNAQLWTPTLASSVPSAKVSLNNSELKNNDKQLALSHEKIENVSPSTTIQLM
ncbi:protein SODIUM POTASSIUM ROOT DEFECTIVE 3 isoform X1 [Lycium ferocissimum]|uniref:protein SODIUM POTASSIUM ROOT DEFECTIVE 3 isoform X1 n=1 Tax=Lycium ferocissimum TaxID=112874 RepID=UPI0028163CFD|nr:protein SODIUM POTASSIUM ROOT DEFECTIVE 3 isoform X1 [Lycium ferocissimum]